MKFDPTRKQDALSAFAVTLDISGAHRWTEWSITAHMAAEAAKHPGNIPWKLNRWLMVNAGIQLSQVMGWTALGALGVFAAGALACIVCIGIDLASMDASLASLGVSVTEAPYVLMSQTILGAFVLFFSCVLFAICGRLVEPARWVEIDWHPSWGNPASRRLVPAEGRAIAAELMRLCPGVTFSVSDLRQDSRSVDPVLHAIVHGVKHPIYVWNEQGAILPPDPYTT